MYKKNKEILLAFSQNTSFLSSFRVTSAPVFSGVRTVLKCFKTVYKRSKPEALMVLAHCTESMKGGPKEYTNI